MRVLPLLLATTTAALLAGCTGSDAAPVAVGEVTRETVAEVVEAPGTVVARASAAVSSPAAGTIDVVSVTEGQRVEAGDVLLRISSQEAQDALAAALGAQAAGGDPTAQALAAAQAQSARETVDALTVRAPIAGVVTLGGSAPGGGAPDLSALVPDGLAGAAESLLGGGGGPSAVTTTADVSPGAPVGEGTPLLSVTDTSAFGVVAEVDETDVLLVERGVRARIELDAVPGTDYSGQVAGVDLQPTSSARGGVGYRVRTSLVVPDGAPAPRPGMSAVVDLQVRESEGALSVPSSAVVRDGEDDVVFLVVDGRAVRTPVRLGAQGSDRVELVDGVQEGDAVVVTDADTLADGDEIDA